MKLRTILPLLLLSCFAAAQDKLPRKGFFGTQTAAITPEIRQQRKLPASGGILISAVTPGSTAEAGGLKPQDVLLSLWGKAVTAPADLVTFVGATLPGTKFTIKINRDGKEMDLELTMKPKPMDKGDNYEVIYDHVVSHGARLRTFVSRPTKVTGKRPVLFIIQGIGQFSHDTPLSSAGAYNQICKAFNDKGFVTLRVDKPGMGDSEGGPFMEITWEKDVDAFRQALLSLKKYDFVDLDNIFIFGHSMGGCEGPIMASEMKVKGLAVYGTVVRTWHEYMLENTRRQSVLAGQTHGQADEDMRGLVAAMHLLLDEQMSPADAKAKFPKWAAGIDGFTPDGRTMSGMPLSFWKGCFAENYGRYWEKVNCNVLSMWGENEFIASQVDHPLIADIVNKANAGKARYVVVPNSDHGFYKTTSMADSFRVWQPGQPKEFNPAFLDILIKWVDEVRAK